MTLDIKQFNDQPGSPGVEAYPLFTVAAFDVTIAAGASRIIQHTTDQGVLPSGTLDNGFLLGGKNIFSYVAASDLPAGGVLKIELSPDGVNYSDWRSYPIIGNGDVDGESGVEISGWAIKITIINSDAVNPQDFIGSIQLKGY